MSQPQSHQLLGFSLGGNAKLPKGTASFSLPSGHSCPGALLCKASADRDTGRVTDGKHATLRCYQTSLEAAYSTLRARNWRNFDLVRAARTTPAIRELILESLPPEHKWDTMRIHIGGDFYNLAYFKAWVEVAEKFPNKKFYAYTTSGHLFQPFLDGGGVLPENFLLTGSMAGKYTAHYDKLVQGRAFIVNHPDETELPIDHDERHAAGGLGDFALLIHGSQPAGTKASEGISRMKREGIPYAYSRKTQ